MIVTIAGEKKEIEQGTTVSRLLVLEKVQTPEYVTVAVNEQFVDSPLKSERVLKEGDQIEFMYFMGGGR
ncbi:MAG: sulfur carrier protein ThiS [Deltaproteobacteria bacterium]|jgi:sulfur carrier protein|nr:sulfur carrier protein ThiS [Deltaproteobacteria bacterium]